MQNIISGAPSDFSVVLCSNDSKESFIKSSIWHNPGNNKWILDWIVKPEKSFDFFGILYEKYKYEFNCTSINSNKWYKFENHKWI